MTELNIGDNITCLMYNEVGFILIKSIRLLQDDNCLWIHTYTLTKIAQHPQTLNSSTEAAEPHSAEEIMELSCCFYAFEYLTADVEKQSPKTQSNTVGEESYPASEGKIVTINFQG